ncbi:MAG: molecular chaperone HtpG [Firmicutes bacterium]|nr:molecular chaperone HtpG [Bacillota bacterium]
MAKRKFKAESKKLLDMMINSIYTHKEIFLRELISNASDAIDKLYYRALGDDSVKVTREDFAIWLKVDKESRTLTVTDNGIGMDEEELESNLGTIAKSGSLDFKQKMEENDEVDIIGQFGVGFYSAFMVSDKVVVNTKPYGGKTGWTWTSEGADGYTISENPEAAQGTEIILHIKEDTEDEKYEDYLNQYQISSLVKKYSDYIGWPIKMEMETSRLKEGTGVEDEKGEQIPPEYETVSEERTLNSMVPLWRKNKSEIEEEEYNSYYKEKFYDFTDPAAVIHTKAEGMVSYDALLFVPQKAPFNYYSKEYERGLALYTNGVMIMEKCPDLVPEYFSFVRGVVDSSDLSLNISRELLQHDRQLKLIEKNIEKKISNELMKMQKDDREKYEKFFEEFGMQIKFGVYDGYGMNKDKLQDLVMFYSSLEQKLVTLKEYVLRMKPDQDKIYYATGETTAMIDALPQVDAVKDKGYEILYMTDAVDEFAVMAIHEYEEKGFVNICSDSFDMGTEEEKEELKKVNEEAGDVLKAIKEALGDRVQEVRFTNKLKNYPVCLTSEGELSIEMEKALNAMPTGEKVKAQVSLDINAEHPLAEKLRNLSGNEQKLKDYAEILYAQARMIAGLSVENPAELSNLICNLM